MVAYFNDKPGVLPGGDQQGPLSDVTNWWNIYYSAKRLIQKCVIEESKLGWSQIGMILEPAALLAQQSQNCCA